MEPIVIVVRGLSASQKFTFIHDFHSNSNFSVVDVKTSEYGLLMKIDDRIECLFTEYRLMLQDNMLNAVQDLVEKDSRLVIVCFAQRNIKNIDTKLSYDIPIIYLGAKTKDEGDSVKCVPDQLSFLSVDILDVIKDASDYITYIQNFIWLLSAIGMGRNYIEQGGRWIFDKIQKHNKSKE